MKRFCKKIVILLLPLVLYYAAFIMMDPFNYFDLSFKETFLSSTEPLPKMRQVMRGNIQNVLLGDSRTSHFDTDYLYEITGDQYYNLGFGGASLKEEIDLFWWAAKYNKLEKVVLQTGFWTVNKGYAGDRIPSLQSVAENPIRILLNWSCHKASWKHLKTIYSKSGGPLVYTDEERAENLRYYAEEIIYPVAAKYETDWDDIEALRDIGQYCEENGITFIVIFPPLDQSIWDIVITPLGLYEEMELAKKTISEFAVVYDMEYPEMDAYSQGDYVDGFHMNGMQDGVDYGADDFVEKYPALTDYLDQMYNGKTEHMHIWRDGKIVAGE